VFIDNIVIVFDDKTEGLIGATLYYKWWFIIYFIIDSYYHSAIVLYINGYAYNFEIQMNTNDTRYLNLRRKLD